MLLLDTNAVSILFKPRHQQWDLPLVTADYRDFEHLDALTLIPLVR